MNTTAGLLTARIQDCSTAEALLIEKKQKTNIRQPK
jgi:hypothetical protein